MRSRQPSLAKSAPPRSFGAHTGVAVLLAVLTLSCTRTQVGGGLVAAGAGAGYEGVGISLGNRMAVGTPIAPKPAIGVPLLFSGLLSGGIGISLVAMGDVHPPRKREGKALERQVAEPAGSIVYPAAPLDPWRADGPRSTLGQGAFESTRVDRPADTAEPP